MNPEYYTIKQHTILTEWIRAPPTSHGGQVVRREEDFKQPVKGLTADEGLQPSGIQTQRTEDIGQGGEDLSRGWDLQ